MASRSRPFALIAGVTLSALAAATAASWFQLKRAERPIEDRTRRRLRANKANIAASRVSALHAVEQ